MDDEWTPDTFPELEPEDPDLSGQYWLTRSADSAGVLADKVDVWLTRPTLVRDSDGSTRWETEEGSHWAKWTVDECRAKVTSHAYPQTYLEVIVVG